MADKDTFYFSHDSNARNDERILELRARFGWEGYGLFWALVESLREASGYKLNRGLIGGLSVNYGVAKDTLIALIDFGLQIGLFEGDETHFWSVSLLRRMEKFEDKKRVFREAGRKGAKKRWGANGEANSPLIGSDSKGKGKGKGKDNNPPTPHEGGGDSGASEEGAAPAATPKTGGEKSPPSSGSRSSDSGSSDAAGSSDSGTPSGRMTVAKILSSVAIPPELESPDFRQLWEKWVAVRMRKKSPGDWQTMFQQQLKMLARYGRAAAIWSIEETIAQGWIGLFPQNYREDRDASGPPSRRGDDGMQGRFAGALT